MREKIAVYGTGTIGACQATLTTGNGYATIVAGHSRAGMERCRQTIAQNWDDLIAQRLVTAENKNAAMELLTITDEESALRECTFVFEAVSEELKVKGEVYAQVERLCAQDTILASCTSSIAARELAGLLNHPERFLIAHPFQPVHMLPLVEVVCHEATADAVLKRTKELLESLKRQVVVLKKSVPGFLVNRFAQALFRESIYLMEQGVTTAADIDRAIHYAVGMRHASIGLLEYFDAVGFELESVIAGNVYPDLCNTREIQETVKVGIRSGKTGQAAGQGLYDWSTIDEADFRYRKQAPYFAGVSEWSLPGAASPSC